MPAAGVPDSGVSGPAVVRDPASPRDELAAASSLARDAYGIIKRRRYQDFAGADYPTGITLK